MKVVERIFEHKIRQQIEVDDMQFAFMKGKGTTDAILANVNGRYMLSPVRLSSVCL